MATVRQDKVQIFVEINGEQVKNTLADLNKAYKTLNSQIRHLTPGQKDFNQKAQELAKAKKAIDDAKKAVQAFNQETQKAAGEAKSLGQKIMEVPGQLAGSFRAALGPLAGMLAAVGIKEFVTELISSAGEMEAFEAKAQTVFGEAMTTVEEFAARNANAMGMTRREYVATAAQAGDLLIPMGFQREEAAKLSTDLVNLSGALSEWSGGQRDSAEVSDILTKALLGEREQLKSLGIAISEADVKQKLMEKGQSKLTGQALEQAKALATLELIYAKSTDAQEAFQKNGNTLLRQQAQWRAWFQDQKDGFIKGMIPAVSAAADWLGNLIGVGNRYSDQLDQERIALNAMVMEITNLNTSNEDRNKLIKQLNDKYPTFLENLEKEKVTNEQLTERLKEVNEQMINRILLQRQQEDIETAAGKAANAQLEAQRARVELSQLLIQASEKFNIQLDKTKTLEEQGAEAAKRLKLGNASLTEVWNGSLGMAGKLTNALIRMNGYTKINDEQTEISNNLQQERMELMKELGITLEETGKKEEEKKKKTFLTDDEKKALQERLKIEQEIQKLTLELMQEGQEKDIALLRQQAQERIAFLKGDAEQVRQQKLLIEQKLELDISRVRQDYAAKEIERLKKEAKEKVKALAGTAEEVIKEQASIEQQLQLDITSLINTTEKEQIDIATANAELRKQLAGENAEQVKLIEQQLQVDITTIQTKAEKLRQESTKEITEQSKEDTKKSYEEQLKRMEEFEKKKKEIEATQRAIEAVQSGRDPKQVEQDLKNELLQIELSFLEAKKALAEQYGLDTVEIQKQIEALRLGIITDSIEQEQKKRQEAKDDFEEGLLKGLEAVSKITDQVAQLSQLSLETRLNRIEAQKQAELKMVGDNEKRKQAVEEKFERQKETAQKQAAQRQKAISSVQTVINTAQSIVKTGAELGYPAAIPFQIIAAGVGLAQLQKINSATFAEGGYTGQPGPGVLPDLTGQRPAGIVHEGEWVAPKWMLSSPVLSPIIAGLEGIREKGVKDRGAVTVLKEELTRMSPASVNYVTNTYADGGLVTTPSDQAVMAARMDTAGELLIQEIKGLKESLNTIQFVTVWGEREAALNSAVDSSLQQRRSKGNL